MNAKIEQPTFAVIMGDQQTAEAHAKRAVCAARIAEPTIATSASRAAAKAANREEQAKRKAEKAAEREAKRAAKAAAKQPPKSWEATKADITAMLREAAGKIVNCPKSTKGLVCVNYLGDCIRRDRLPQYAAALRRACEVRWEYIGKWPAAVFENELRTAGGDEAVALSLLGVLFHDDRGDGLIHVPAFKTRGRMEAWRAACAAVGAAESKVRPA